MITISRYMPNESEHAICVDLGEIRLYYSYEMPVAFWIAGEGMAVSENVWTRTTGKHINRLLQAPGTVVPLAAHEYTLRLRALLHRIEYALTHLELARRIEEAEASNERMAKGSGV